MKVIRSALLEIEHAQKPDDKNDGRRDSQGKIGKQNFPRALGAQFVSDQDELDDQGRDQRERRDVMKEGKQRVHRATPRCKLRQAKALRIRAKPTASLKLVSAV